MPNGQPAQLANLRPFPKGHRAPKKADSAKSKALHGAKLASPEAVEFNLAIMRDPNEHMGYRLRASENILKVAFPAKNVSVDLESQGAGTRFLEVIFVHQRPDAIEVKPNGHGTFEVGFNADE